MQQLACHNVNNRIVNKLVQSEPLKLLSKLCHCYISILNVLKLTCFAHTMIQPPPLFGDNSGLTDRALGLSKCRFVSRLSSESDVYPRSFPIPLSSSCPISPSDFAAANNVVSNEEIIINILLHFQNCRNKHTTTFSKLYLTIKLILQTNKCVCSVI